MKIYDSVHGFIHFNEIEAELIDSEPFQRLLSIHQLGITYKVYPGATHSRFAHSIGVMELATRMFDRIALKQEIPDCDYYRQIIRLAALCHDLGHLPFSHVAESAVLGKEGHEKWTLEIIESSYLKPIWKKLENLYPGKPVLDDLLKFSLGEEKLKELRKEIVFSIWDHALGQIISADFFGADRIDYLVRDALSTGVSYGLLDYDQLIEMLILLNFNGILTLGIEENGIATCEALLLARHFMHQRVYQYHSVKAYSFHLSRFISSFYQFTDLEQYLSLTDHEVLADLKRSDSPDARAILRREGRFKAILIPDHIRAEEIKIPNLYCEIKPAAPQHFSFPVLKRNGMIVDAKSCSQLSIPSLSSNWVFVPPQSENELYRVLENEKL